MLTMRQIDKIKFAWIKKSPFSVEEARRESVGASNNAGSSTKVSVSETQIVGSMLFWLNNN